jgi:hypothetical protein
MCVAATHHIPPEALRAAPSSLERLGQSLPAAVTLAQTVAMLALPRQRLVWRGSPRA